jgi:hypothetical protein
MEGLSQEEVSTRKYQQQRYSSGGLIYVSLKTNVDES